MNIDSGVCIIVLPQVAPIPEEYYGDSVCTQHKVYASMVTLAQLCQAFHATGPCTIVCWCNMYNPVDAVCTILFQSCGICI